MAWTYWVWPRLKQPKLWEGSEGGPSVVLGRPLEQAPRIHPLMAVSGGAVGIAAAGRGDGVEGRAEVGVVGEGNGAGGAGGHCWV